MRWSSHRSTRSIARRLRAGALLFDHRHRGLDQCRVSLVEDDQHVGLGVLERPARLGGVVQTEDGRRGVSPEDPPAGIEAVGEGGEPEGAPFLARGHRVDPEATLGDHPEGALAADEQLGEVRSGCRPGPVPTGPDDAAVGQHDLEADDHVFDLPVAVRVLSRSSAGQPSADRGEVHRLRPVAEGEAEP